MHVELDTSFLRPLFGSACCWIRRSLDMIWTYSFLNRMFLYVFFVLDSSLSLASPLPFAFAIGLRLLPFFRPCARCRASIYHLVLARLFDHRTSSPIRRRMACHQQDSIPFSFSFPHSLLSPRSVYSLSLSRTRTICIQAQPWRTPGSCGPFPPLSVSLCAGQLCPFSLILSRLFLDRLVTLLSPLKNTRPWQQG